MARRDTSDPSDTYEHLAAYLYNAKTNPHYVNFFRRGICIVNNAKLMEISQTTEGPQLQFLWDDSTDPQLPHHIRDVDVRREHIYNIETDTIAFNPTNDPIDKDLPMKDTDVALHDNDQIDTNADGGKKSHLEYAFELIEPEFSKRMAHVLYTGMQKYGARNWQQIPVDVNIGRAMYHLTQALEGVDNREDHFANAACRVMFAMLTAKGVPYPTGKI